MIRQDGSKQAIQQLYYQVELTHKNGNNFFNTSIKPLLFNTYRVHYDILVCRPFPSQYFKSTFSFKDPIEAQIGCTMLALSTAWGDVFPLFLDSTQYHV